MLAFVVKFATDRGYKANLISTIVDKTQKIMTRVGYKANLISTIVDSGIENGNPNGL